MPAIPVVALMHVSRACHAHACAWCISPIQLNPLSPVNHVLSHSSCPYTRHATRAHRVDVCWHHVGTQRTHHPWLMVGLVCCLRNTVEGALVWKGKNTKQPARRADTSHEIIQHVEYTHHVYVWRTCGSSRLILHAPLSSPLCLSLSVRRVIQMWHHAVNCSHVLLRVFHLP